MSKPRAKDAEDFPIGTTVRTPTGRLARVMGHRGMQGRRARKGRGHRTWLVCVYLDACKRAREAGTVLLLPELATVVPMEQVREAA